MIESVVGPGYSNPPPENDQSKFAQWFQSEGTQVMIGGLFDAIGSMGAGMAGISPGGLDRSSVARGAENAQGAWDRAQFRWDAKQFTAYIDQRIAAEKKLGAKADQEKIMTLQMLRRNPKEAIKAHMGGENWRERMDYAYGIHGAKRDDAYAQALGIAMSFYDKMIPAEMKLELMNGDAKAFNRLMNMPHMTEHIGLLFGKGGPLNTVVMKAEEKKDGGVWESIKGFFGQGDDEGPSYATTETGTPAGPSDYATSEIVGKERKPGGIGAGFLLPAVQGALAESGTAEYESFLERARKGDPSLYPERPF
jgi:hypothetical protein